MSYTAFENLAAANVLQRVCEYLDHASLLHFALASKQCQRLSNTHLLRNIDICVFSRAKLQLEVDYWSRRLERNSCFVFVRRIRIVGYMPSLHQDTGKIEPTKLEKLNSSREESDDSDSIWATDKNPWYPIGFDDTPPEESLREDSAWKPLARFISQLPALSDLVYACVNQFTPCLLQTLHQTQPNCRLHLKTFHLCSLKQPTTDPHEFALITSPCLHSISVRHSTWDLDATDDLYGAAVVRIASGLAPNLKDIRLSHLPTGVSLALNETWSKGTSHPWHGFSQDTQYAHLNPAELKRFESNSYTTKELLETWNRHVSFSHLKFLKLDGTVEGDALGWAAENCFVPSLTTLALNISPTGERAKDTVQYHIYLDSFLRSLPPLTNIRLSGRLQETTLNAVVECHGVSLRRLWLSANQEYDRLIFSVEQVNYIRGNCLGVEELILNPIPRTQGDVREAAIYKSLGGFPRLRKLTLTLDSSNFPLIYGAELIDDHNEDEYLIPNDPSFDEFHQEFADNNSRYYQPRKGHIRHALINSALDEGLARAIFDYISSNKALNTFPLEYLKLISKGGGDFGGYMSPALDKLTNTLECLGRNWLLTRSIRDDSRDKIIARQVGQWSGIDSAWPIIEPIFRRLWPETEGASNWTRDWHSWPLDINT